MSRNRKFCFYNKAGIKNSAYLAAYIRNVDNIDIRTEDEMLDLIRETKPWIEGKWKWKSFYITFLLENKPY